MGYIETHICGIAGFLLRPPFFFVENWAGVNRPGAARSQTALLGLEHNDDFPPDCAVVSTKLQLLPIALIVTVISSVCSFCLLPI